MIKDSRLLYKKIHKPNRILFGAVTSEHEATIFYAIEMQGLLIWFLLSYIMFMYNYILVIFSFTS